MGERDTARLLLQRHGEGTERPVTPEMDRSYGTYSPGLPPAASSHALLVAPSSTKAINADSDERFRHACRVPFCTTHVPGVSRTSAPSSSSRSTSPLTTMPKSTESV